MNNSVYSTSVSSSSFASRVFSILAMTLIPTTIGAYIAPNVGLGIILIAVIGAVIATFALNFAKEVQGLNLGLLCFITGAFGMLLGYVVNSYIRSGSAGIVLDAAATTAVVTAVAAGYGWSTKRNLSGLGGYLFVALIGVIVASLIGIFIHLAFLYLLISIVSVVIFTGYIVYDINNIANSQGTEGDAIVMALSVYLDIVNLFLNLLRIFSILTGRD